MKSLVHYALATTVAFLPITAQSERARRSSQSSSPRIEELHRIGLEIVGAVLAHDVETITRYSRADLVASDRKDLNDPKSELSCYVFGTCAVKQKKRSVYDFLRSAKSLAVSISTVPWGDNTKDFAVIYFYDAAEVTRDQLFNSVELCKKHGIAIFTWVFRSAQGRWIASHPPFDTETDWFCPISEEAGS
jgi:hypothetical protein